jgi:predicted RNA-binding protein YlqC (UPF0109 family)
MQKSPKEVLEFILSAIVDNPDEVRVEESKDEMGVLLTIHAHKDDMGKIIGREGQNAKGLRSIIRQVGYKSESRVSVTIAEPNA